MYYLHFTILVNITPSLFDFETTEVDMSSKQRWINVKWCLSRPGNHNNSLDSIAWQDSGLGKAVFFTRGIRFVTQKFSQRGKLRLAIREVGETKWAGMGDKENGDDRETGNKQLVSKSRHGWSGWQRWKSWIRVASIMLLDGIQLLSSGPYPSQPIRYWWPWPRRRTTSNRFTVNTNPPSMNRGGGGVWRLDQHSLLHWFDPSHMERWMKPQGSGELKSNSCQIHHLRDRKRTNKARSQLTWFDPQRKILSWQPHLLPGSVRRSCNSPAICCPLSSSQASKQNLTGYQPGQWRMRAWADGMLTSSSQAGNTSGWWPKAHWKGERPGEEQGRVLCAYSTQIRCLLHLVGFWETRQVGRSVSSSWFKCSVWTLDWRWYPDVRLTVVPKREQKPFQNRDAKCGPRSDTTSFGNPWSLKTCLNITSAVSLAEGNLGRGIKWVRKSVHHSEDSCVTFWGRQTCDEVQKDVRQGAMRHWKGA